MKTSSSDLFPVLGNLETIIILFDYLAMKKDNGGLERVWDEKREDCLKMKLASLSACNVN